MRRRHTRSPLVLAALIVSGLIAAYTRGDFGRSAARPGIVDAAAGQLVSVRSVIDGDTLALATGERVRLIGIDTPEVHESAKLHRDARRLKVNPLEIIAMGKRSWEYAKSLCQGRRVRLEFDVEQRDKYNRLLAYVYLEDGTFVNAKMVEEGYASLMRIPPNTKHAALFDDLYRQARQEKRGLWQE